MDISYANARVQDTCTDEKIARKKLGKDGEKVLTERLKQISKAENLEQLKILPGRYHELVGDRKGQVACSLRDPKRLVFVPTNDPRPVKSDGGLDWSRITAIKIIEIVDYH